MTLVTLAERPHPFPSRTRQLSSPAPKILRGQPFGKIGRRRGFCVKADRALALAVAAVAGLESPSLGLGDSFVAPWAGFAAMVVDRPEAPHFVLECGRNTISEYLNGVGKGGTHRPIQLVHFLRCKSAASAGWKKPRGVEDFVRAGVADTGHEFLIPQQVLQLSRVAADTSSPHLERQIRIVRIWSQLVDPRAGEGWGDFARQ